MLSVITSCDTLHAAVASDVTVTNLTHTHYVTVLDQLNNGDYFIIINQPVANGLTYFLRDS